MTVRTRTSTPPTTRIPRTDTPKPDAHHRSRQGCAPLWSTPLIVIRAGKSAAEYRKAASGNGSSGTIATSPHLALWQGCNPG